MGLVCFVVGFAPGSITARGYNMEGVPTSIPVGASLQVTNLSNAPGQPQNRSGANSETAPPVNSPDYDVNISPEAQKASASLESSNETKSPKTKKMASHINGDTELNTKEEKEVQDMKMRDEEVRAHERAHKIAGGRYIRSAKFTYDTGPDNHRYVTGGEVTIDVSKVPNDPEATIRKMETVKRAALAPRDPSPQDHSAHAMASQVAMEARREMKTMEAEERQGEGKTNSRVARSQEGAEASASVQNITSTVQDTAQQAYENVGSATPESTFSPTTA